MEAYLTKIYNLVELTRQNLPFGGWELVFVGIFFFYKQIFRLIRSAIFFGIVIALIGGVFLKYTDFLDSAKNQQIKKYFSIFFWDDEK